MSRHCVIWKQDINNYRLKQGGKFIPQHRKILTISIKGRKPKQKTKLKSKKRGKKNEGRKNFQTKEYCGFYIYVSFSSFAE